MPRKPRLHVPGGLYHVILRGNARQAIFFDNEDRNHWESILAKGLNRYGHRIHAYCWMTNHVHMAIQCSGERVSSLIRDVASQYARSINRKMRRSGHLFERRHRSILVQADNYLVTLVRYIHQNPLHAGLVDDIDKYRWSSHNAYLGRGRPEWLTIDWALSMFGNSRKTAIKSYNAFVRADAGAHITKQISCGNDSDDRIFGDDGFADAADAANRNAPATEGLDEIIERVCTAHQSSEGEIASKSGNHRNAAIRAEIALEAIEARAATLATVARRFGRSESVLSRSVNRLRAKKAIS